MKKADPKIASKGKLAIFDSPVACGTLKMALLLEESVHEVWIRPLTMCQRMYMMSAYEAYLFMVATQATRIARQPKARICDRSDVQGFNIRKVGGSNPPSPSKISIWGSSSVVERPMFTKKALGPSFNRMWSTLSMDV